MVFVPSDDTFVPSKIIFVPTKMRSVPKEMTFVPTNLMFVAQGLRENAAEWPLQAGKAGGDGGRGTRGAMGGYRTIARTRASPTIARRMSGRWAIEAKKTARAFSRVRSRISRSARATKTPPAAEATTT